MNPPLRRNRLRHAAFLVLFDAARPLEVHEIVEQLLALDQTFTRDPSRAVSDALRTEVLKNRVIRLEHGVYVIGDVTSRHVTYARSVVHPRLRRVA
jgi:hypothetical protein